MWPAAARQVRGEGGREVGRELEGAASWWRRRGELLAGSGATISWPAAARRAPGRRRARGKKVGGSGRGKGGRELVREAVLFFLPMESPPYRAVGCR